MSITFTNPAEVDSHSIKQRSKMTRLSIYGFLSFSLRLPPRFTLGYSCLTKLHNKLTSFIYEIYAFLHAEMTSCHYCVFSDKKVSFQQ